MAIRFGDVATWEAAPLGEAGDGLKKDADELEKSRDNLETQAIPSSWQGLSRIVAAARRDGLVAQLTVHIEGKRKLQRAFYTAENEVTEIERLVGNVLTTAREQQFQLDFEGTVTDVATPPEFGNRTRAEEYHQTRTHQAQQLADDITAILGKAAHADATIANGIPEGHVDFIDHYGVAAPDVAERWATLTDAERRAIIEQQIEELAEEYGVERPNLVWEDPSWGPWGSWADGEPGTLTLNEGILDDPQILNTIGHEMQHARQHEAIRDKDDFHFPWQDDPFDDHEEDGITEDQAEEWDENFDDYQSTENGDTYEEYFEQPVERDARREGKEHLEGLTDDELDRQLEESR